MKNKGGRPTVMTELTVKKLEEAFAFGCTDKEACFFADISYQTLYDYQAKHPEFIERKEALKDSPILKARQTVSEKLSESYQNAMDYLKRKRKAEFGDSSSIEVTVPKPITELFTNGVQDSPKHEKDSLFTEED
jgi:hypothetical protein